MNAESSITTFAAHPFRFLWNDAPPGTADEALAAMSQVERRAADLILRNEPDPASAAALQRLFMPYHQNGTFTIGVRRGPALPSFIRGESGDLTTWIRSTTRSDLVRMLYAQALPSHVSSHEFDGIAAVVGEAFHYRGSDGRLCDQIPNQNYVDYIRRCIGLYLHHDADIEFDTEASYNDFATEIALLIISTHAERLLHDAPTISTLRTLMVYSLLAGVIGLDMKCSHCAASRLTTDNAATSHGDPAPARVDAVVRWLVTKAADARLYCAELFAWDAYSAVVLSRPCTLYVFPDDLGETVVDVFRLQAEMMYNPGLRVVFVPRNGRFHNDCALEDVDALLEHRCFAPLRELRDRGRFVVNANGPRNGAVERPKMNRRLVDRIAEDADVLFVKGSRSYEMVATGVRIPTFCGQTVSREFSESVTGASAAAGVPVLRFCRAFPDYWGFQERHRRIEPLFPTGQLGWQAAMTAIDSARFTASRQFREACSTRTIDDVATEIMARAEERHIPPHRVPLGRPVHGA